MCGPQYMSFNVWPVLPLLFFLLDQGFFCFIISGVLVENLSFFTLVKFYKCMFYFGIFYSRTVVCRVSSQYS